MQNTNAQNYFWGQRAIGVGIVALVAAVYLFIRYHDDKSKFNHIQGRIEFLEKEWPGVSRRDPEKYRYLKIEGYDRIFELYVDENRAESAHSAKHIDDLLPDDAIDLYYDDNFVTADKPINALTQFVEKDGQLYFRRGNGSLIAAGFLFFGSLGLIFWGIKLVKKHKNARLLW